VKLAEDYELTLVGYARGGRAVVYTGAGRVQR
jgi:formate dehydrogenase assembly factor FdhD